MPNNIKGWIIGLAFTAIGALLGLLYSIWVPWPAFLAGAGTLALLASIALLIFDHRLSKRVQRTLERTQKLNEFIRASYLGNPASARSSNGPPTQHPDPRETA
mgnify:CR=1 FL=1